MTSKDSAPNTRRSFSPSTLPDNQRHPLPALLSLSANVAPPVLSPPPSQQVPLPNNHIRSLASGPSAEGSAGRELNSSDPDGNAFHPRLQHVQDENGHHIIVGREGKLASCEDEVHISPIGVFPAKLNNL
ncbi:hypothetical protein C8R46DRAFT_336688 [Mycena filopes]|nr:hypothetical protein C8R46DRAFT_336688 [Mycena filopes]